LNPPESRAAQRTVGLIHPPGSAVSPSINVHPASHCISESRSPKTCDTMMVNMPSIELDSELRQCALAEAAKHHPELTGACLARHRTTAFAEQPGELSGREPGDERRVGDLLSERTNPDEDGLAAGERFRTIAFHLTLLALFISQASPLVVQAQDRLPVTLSGAEIQVEARSRLSAPGPQERRFAAYIEGLATAAGHQDRQAPLENYCKGLLLPGEQVRNYVLPAMQKQEPVVAWIMDDTGFPKKVQHSVGGHSAILRSSG
jgi:hypothetical protein